MSASKPTVKDIFDQAAEMSSLEDRRAFLDRACAASPAVRKEVDELLSAYASAGSLLDRPIVAPVDPAALETVKQSPMLGTVIAGRYKLIEIIGEGAMGTVYCAAQTSPLKLTVALKVVKAGMDSKRVLARFDAERQALALMDHPNIAKVLDAGTTEDGHPFFVMDMVKGTPLTQYCDEHRLNVEQRLLIFQQICHGVQHAHQKAIIHRDLKPGNILVEEQDGRPVPKIIDFGLAKAVNVTPSIDQNSLTQIGGVVGTPLYMAPEQADFNAIDVDTRADIYSLGVILYEMLTGSTPVERKRFAQFQWNEVCRVIREEIPPTPSSRLSSTDSRASIAAQRQIEPAKLDKVIRGDLDWIVMMALRKERDQRYGTANAFAADIGRFLGNEPVVAGPPSRRYRARKFLQRNRIAAVLSLLIASLLILGIVGTSIGLARALRAERAASLSAQGEADQRRDAESSRDTARSAETHAKEEAAVAEAVRSFLQDLLSEAAPEKNPRNKRISVEELLARASKRIAGQFEGQPLVEAAIRQTIGETYFALGDYKSAEEHVKRALELRKSVRGDRDVSTLNSMSGLGLIYKEQGRYPEAEPLLKAAWEIRMEDAGPDDLAALAFANNLAITYAVQAKFDLAETMLRQIVETRLRVLPKDHLDTLSSIGSLGLTYQGLGRYPASKTELTNALEGYQRVHPDKDHPDTLRAMNNLASTLQAMGQREDARKLFDRVLVVRRLALSIDHPYTITSISNLATIYLDLNRFVEAKDLLMEALAASRKIRSDNDLQSLQILHNLGVACYNLKEFDEAVKHLKAAMDGRTKALVPGHPHTLSSMGSLGGAYAELKQFEKAEEYLKAALKLGEQHRPVDDPEVFQTAHNLAYLYQMQNKLKEAEPHYIRALEGRKKTLGDSHPLTQSTAQNLIQLYQAAAEFAKGEVIGRWLENVLIQQTGKDSLETAGVQATLGLNLLAQGKFQEAEKTLRECLKTREDKLKDDWRTFNTKSALGAALLGLKRYDESKPLLLDGYEGIRAREKSIQPPFRNVRIEEAVKRIVQYYEAVNEPAEAAKWKARLQPKKSEPLSPRKEMRRPYCSGLASRSCADSCE